MSAMVEAARRSDLTGRIALAGEDGFVTNLSHGINELVTVAEQVVADMAALMESLSQGNLTCAMSGQYEGAFRRLTKDANTTTNRLNDVLAQVVEMSHAVTLGSADIAQGNQSLAQRAAEQAASLETTTSAMEQMLGAVRKNASNAERASALANSTRETAEKGGAVVTNAVTAMSEVNQSSRKIEEIARIIDDIASQTNLLALNAAVEAVRAGAQGRGFGVVATEVRTLAQRCATAAHEIRALIQDSVARVDEGYKLVSESGAKLEGIVDSVQELSDIVARISHASTEQSDGIELVNNAIVQIDEATQQTAAMVEETAAASAEMGEQAQAMARLMSFFTLSQQASGAARVTHIQP